MSKGRTAQLAASSNSERWPDWGERGSRARWGPLRAQVGGLGAAPAHLPAALTGLLFEAQAPALRAGLPTVVHGEDDRPGKQDSGGPAANDGTQQGLTAS